MKCRIAMAASILLAIAGSSCSSAPKTEEVPVADREGSGDKFSEFKSIDFGKSASTEKGSGGPNYRLKLVKITDTGFGEPMEVVRFLIPADWSAQGGVTWDNKQLGCPANIVQLAVRAASPDGMSGLEFTPATVWISASDPGTQQIIQQAAANGSGCPVGPAVASNDYLQRIFLPRARRNASVVEAKPLPQVAEAKRAAAAPTLDAMMKQGSLKNFALDSYSVHIEYPQNGQAVEEWLSTTLANLVMPSVNSSALMQGQVAMSATQTVTSAEGVLGLRAPKGKFDEQLAATIITSIRPNPVYIAAVSKFQNNMNNIALRGAMDRARIWREAQAEIGGILQDSYRRQQAAQDRAAAQFSQYIRGVSTYVNPATGEKFEIPSGYNGVWIGPSGEYVVSNTPGFNPGSEYGGGWTELRTQN